MKRVQMTLEGLNGNGVFLLGAFAAAARQQGWAESEIDSVHHEAMAGNYDHLLQTLSDHIQAPPGAEGLE